MTQYKDTDLAYIAGFMDGEGCYTIARKKRPNGNYSYMVYVACGQKATPENITTIKWIQSLFGGSVFFTKGTGNRCDVVAIGFTCQDALKFVHAVYPYIKTKKAQADIIIEFQEKYVTRNVKKNDRSRFAKQEDMFWKMREHNQKNKVRLQRLSEKTS
jgi:hypothetical protein